MRFAATVTSSLCVLFASAAPAPEGASGGSSTANWEKSLVHVRIHGQEVRWKEPWHRQSPYTHSLNGLVVEGKRILIPGTSLFSPGFIEVRRPGKELWREAKLVNFDGTLPLAVLEVADESFWAGLTPAPLAENVAQLGEVTVLGWSNERMASARSNSIKLEVGTHSFGRFGLLSLRASGGGDTAGVGDILVSQGKVVGLSTSKNDGAYWAIAAPFLRLYLKAVGDSPYRGFGRGGFAFEPLTNPALRELYGLGEDQGGIRLRTVHPSDSASGALKVDDLVLAIDGRAIDAQGRFAHPLYGRMPLGLILTDGHRAGDTLEFQVLRGGKALKVPVTLKRTSPQDDRVPSNMVGAKADWEIVGGLVFQHLTHSYLSIFGGWRESGPPRLVIADAFYRELPSADARRIVVMTHVLPDAVNLGYQDLNNLLLDTVNGKPVRHLDELRSALAQPQGGFHVFEFAAGQAVRRVVLDVAETEAAKARVDPT